MAAAIESVLNQSLAEFELIIIDDGSNDDSFLIAERYEKLDGRVKAFSRENLGVIVTRNELILKSSADLVAWMDADDISMPTRLEMLVNSIEVSTDLVCVGSFARCIDPDGNYLNLETFPIGHQEIKKRQLLGGGLRFPTSVMRKDAVNRAGGFRSPFQMGEDLDLLIRLGESGYLSNIPIELYLYRQHLDSTCALLGSNWRLCLATILDLASERQTSGLDRLQRGVVVSLPWSKSKPSSHRIAMIYFRWAFYANKNHNFKLSLKYATLSALRRPLSRSVWFLIFLSLLGIESGGRNTI